MAATEQLFKQLLQICATDFGGDEFYSQRGGGFAELCFPNYDLDHHLDSSENSNDGPSWIPRVQIIDEPNVKNATKFLLDAAQMHHIACYVLPRELAFRRWKRLFSLARDGASFDDCMKSIKGDSQTLMIVRTTGGDTFGGFSDAPWETDNHEFHGSERTKLFSFASSERRSCRSLDALDDSSSDNDDAKQSGQAESLEARDDREEKMDKKKPLVVYTWSGMNRDFQYCDPSRTLMGFGGGGARFGLSVENNFRFGSTGPCDTFFNDRLGGEGNFRVLDVEIWGFVAVEETCCSLLCFQANHQPEADDVAWIPPVRVVRELARPEKFILDQAKMDQIARFVLPQTIAACRWKRVYSLGRDGDSFESCLHLIRKEQRSLMIIRTDKGEVFGGYADSPWRACHCNYYGSAQACLWTFAPDSQEQEPQEATTEPTDQNYQLNVYKWTGINRYIQYCDFTHRILAFGGGGDAGSFGLCIEKDFQRGSTGPCATFGNEPLCKEEHFRILDLEIWGFLTGEF